MGTARDIRRSRALATWIALTSCLGVAFQGMATLPAAALGPAAPGPTPPAEEQQRLFVEAERLERLAAAYAGYYSRPVDVPARLLRVGLSPDDVSVALWIAGRSIVDPYAIASIRTKSGLPWHEIMRMHRVPTRALAVRLDGPRPRNGPYARAYRVLAGLERGPLADAEVRDLVQLRLVSEHYRQRPSHVMARRAAGRRAVDLIVEAQAAGGGRPPVRAAGGRS